MLYDYPHYYEAAFSFRDIASEAAVIEEALRRYSDIHVRTALELGCGTAPHAGELAASGRRYLGLDINHNMLDYARRRWSGVSPEPTFLHGDMTAFHLGHPVDFAFVLLGSLYAESPGELASHFDSVARALNPGGIYLLDGCVQFGDPLDFDGSTYTLERDGIRVESHFALRLLDAETDLYEESWTVTVNDRGVEKVFHTVERNRSLKAEAFLDLVAASRNFELVGWFDDWDLAAPLSVHSKSTRPLVLLRRTE